MPKGSIRNPGTTKTRHARIEEEFARRAQKRVKAANVWNEMRAAGTATAGNATKSLRKSMREVRAEPGGASAIIRENPFKALKRRAAQKPPKKDK